MCSYFPLSSVQLIAAVCQDPDSDEVEEVDINDINSVLEACQNLLTVDFELKTCRFPHLSVQEYFEENHWSSSETNALLAKVCLSLLHHDSTVKELGAEESDAEKPDAEGSNAEKPDMQPINEEERKIDSDDLLMYAHIHWATHVQRHGEDNIDNHLAALLKRFLGSMNESSLAYQKWHKTITRFFERRSFRKPPNRP